MKTPLISVVMPAYNAEKFVRRAIDSILSQTFGDFEFIIINDGSTDKTAEIIKSYSDKRIIFINNKINSKMIAALNSGLDLAQGEYIARMDADDESLPTRFAEQITFLQNNPQIDVLGTAVLAIKKNKTKLGLMPLTHAECLDFLIADLCCGHPTVMCRRGLFEQHNARYDKNYYYAEDYRFFTELAMHGAQFANLPTPLLKHYIHDENVTIKHFKRSRASVHLARKHYRAFGYDHYFGRRPRLLFGLMQKIIKIATALRLKPCLYAIMASAIAARRRMLDWVKAE